MKRVLIDAVHLVNPFEDGCYRYVDEYVRVLQQESGECEWEIDLLLRDKLLPLGDYSEDVLRVFQRSRKYQKFKEFVKKKIYKVSPLLFQCLKTAKRKVVRLLPAREKRSISFDRYDIVHITVPSYYQLFKNVGSQTKIVMTVHDMSHLTVPHCHEPDTVRETTRGVEFAVQKASKIITISKYTKKEFLRFYPHYPDEDVIPVYLGYDRKVFYPERDPQKAQDIRRKYKIENCKYILSVSTLEPRKNLRNLIRAFDLFLQKSRASNVKLVLVGRMGWKIEDLVNEIEGKDQILRTGHVPDEDLAPLYSDALMFCYVSFYEGFGLPLLEAMACGTPTLYADNTSMPEVVGDAGLPVKPDDIEDIANKMLIMYENDNLRARLSEEGLKRCKNFTWEKHARKVIELYSSLL